MSLSTLRAQTTKRIAGIELPACFQLATIAAATNALDRNTKAAKVSRRRLADKATKLASVEAQS